MKYPSHLPSQSWLRLTASLCLVLAAPLAQAELYVTIVQGLGGMPEYQRNFDSQRQRIHEASVALAGENFVTSFSGEDATREALLTHFEQKATRMNDNDRAAIYLIGHGSWDGSEYKFNIPGPDITTADLDAILDQLPGQNHFLVNTSSTSGAILEKLEKDGRLIITATRSGNERNATEFGAFFAEALVSESADLNKNNTVSVQEAFDFAERRTAAFYETAGRLATEHPQIRGEGAAQFSLTRITDAETAAIAASGDPEMERLLAERQRLDNDIEALQLRRSQLDNQDYVRQLQALILESAMITEEIDRLRGSASGGGSNDDEY